jgi:hypothetical protein
MGVNESSNIGANASSSISVSTSHIYRHDD